MISFILRLQVKISDFGLSREGESYQMTSAKRLPIKWLAPETLTTGIYTPKSDVFSLGVCIWEIFANGMDPYQVGLLLTSTSSVL